MSRARPSVQEERWLVLAARYPRLAALPSVSAAAGGWRRARLLTRCLFFVLGAVAALLATLLVMLLQVPAFLLVSGLLLIGAAEILIREQRLFAYGVEEALLLCGALALALESVSGSWPQAERYAMLLCGIATLAAGLRLLNPLFTAGGVLLVTAGLQVRYSAQVTALTCLALAGLALALGARRYERPAHDRMLDYLVVVLGPACYVWLTRDQHLALTPAALRGADWRPWLPVLAPLLFAAVALAVGLRRRRHAPLLAVALCLACIGYELREFSGLVPYQRLILWGLVLLAVGLALDRLLRRPRGGITSRRPQAPAPLGEGISLVGAASLTPQDSPSAQPQGGGGQFGGGGASDRF